MTVRNALTTGTPERSGPRWLADWRQREFTIPGGAQIDASVYFPHDSLRIVVGVGGAAQGATTVPVVALETDVPSGTAFDLGTNKFIRTTADALAGATSLTTAAIPTAVVAGDVGRSKGHLAVEIPSGTVVGRTFAEAATNDPFGIPADADDELYFISYSVVDATKDDDIVLVRPGATIRTNFLPAQYAGLSSAIKAKLAAKYVLTVGAE